MDIIQGIIDWANGILWGPFMLVILLGTHLYLTFRLKFVQRYIFTAIKLSVSKDEKAEGDISPFGALASALAATIGTGNIVGVSIAVSLGGPGAVLWCWFTGVFGMATKYAESLLAVKYRVKTSDGTMIGGPMYTILNGLNMKWLAVLFCVFTAIAAFGIGNTVQANSVAGVVFKSTGIPNYVTGLFMASLLGLVVLGGVKAIARVSSALVPFMAILYVLGCVAILIMNGQWFGETVAMIVTYAFTPQAAGGGFVGATVMMAARLGVMRGLYSNESGMGSAPIFAAAARSKNPVRQALISMTGTFWDTVIICPLTGFVIVSSILKDQNIFQGLEGGAIASAAFSQLPIIGLPILNIGIVLFAFTTILGWVYYGEKAMEFLFGKSVIKFYRVFYCVLVFFGAIMSLSVVWGFADAMNALMVLPNVVSLWMLAKVVSSETEKYLYSGRLDMPSSDPIPYADNVKNTGK